MGKIAWPRANPKKLKSFDPTTKICVMNCGQHRDDPRTRKEVKFLCGDCEVREALTPEIKTFRQEIMGTERVTFVVIESGQIVGIADIARYISEEDPVLGNLFVAETQRGKGVGRALISEAQRWAKENKTILWISSVPWERTRQWYARCGFKETGRRDDFGRVEMKWEG